MPFDAQYQPRIKYPMLEIHNISGEKLMSQNSGVKDFVNGCLAIATSRVRLTHEL